MGPASVARRRPIRHCRVRCRDHPLRGRAEPRMVTSQASGSSDPPAHHGWGLGDARRRDGARRARARVDVESRLALRQPRRRDRPHGRDPAATHHAAPPAVEDRPRSRRGADRPHRGPAGWFRPSDRDGPGGCDCCGRDRRDRGEHRFRNRRRRRRWSSARRGAALPAADCARIRDDLHVSGGRPAVRGVQRGGRAKRTACRDRGWRCGRQSRDSRRRPAPRVQGSPDRAARRSAVRVAVRGRRPGRRAGVGYERRGRGGRSHHGHQTGQHLGLGAWAQPHGARAGVHERHRTTRDRGGRHRLNHRRDAREPRGARGTNLEGLGVPHDRGYGRRVGRGGPLACLAPRPPPAASRSGRDPGREWACPRAGPRAARRRGAGGVPGEGPEAVTRRRGGRVRRRLW